MSNNTPLTKRYTNSNIILNVTGSDSFLELILKSIWKVVKYCICFSPTIMAFWIYLYAVDPQTPLGKIGTIVATLWFLVPSQIGFFFIIFSKSVVSFIMDLFKKFKP